MLVLIGIGFSIGNHLGGKFADLSLEKTLIGFLVLLMVMMLVFPVLAQTTVGAAIGLVIWGGGGICGSTATTNARHVSRSRCAWVRLFG